MADRVMIYEVAEDGGLLVLLDGRRIRVDADQLCTTCTWLPTTAVDIEERADRLGLTVTREEDGASVTGQWDR